MTSTATAGALPSAARKGPALFLGFCLASLLIVIGFCLGGWYLMAPRLLQWGQAINWGIGGLILGFLFLLCGGFSLIFITVITGVDFLYPHGQKSLTVRLLFPIATGLSRLLRVSRDGLRESFVSVNNAMTKAQAKRLSGERLLVLLPHCLQIDKCNRNVTRDINNCRQCGQCLVGELKEAAQGFGVNAEVVNGGTLARRRVAQMRPTGIVAVACERDLTLGIQDVYPIPVIGVINDRPYGPCHNTRVDMVKVAEAISFFRSRTIDREKV